MPSRSQGRPIATRWAATHVATCARAALAAAALWWAPACSGPVAVPPGRHVTRARTLIVAAAAEPRSLLPPYAVDLVEGELCDLLYQRLAVPVAGFSTVGDHDYRPALATAWAWAPDSLSLRFTLDSAARWHDGAPVTSRDVQFTFALLRDSAALVPRPPLSDAIDSVAAPDARTAVVWAHRRSPTLFHDVTFPVHVLPAHLLDTVPRAALGRHARQHAPVGSGPFRFRAWVPGVQIDLEPVGPRPTGAAQRVVLRFFPSAEAATAALVAGDVDVLDYVRPHDLPRLARVPRLRALRLPGFSYAMLQFNLRARPASRDGMGRAAGRRAARPAPHPLFGDARVRRALAMSVDRVALTRNLLGDGGAPSLGPVTRALATADTTRPGIAYDRVAAERLFDAAGWRRSRGNGIRRRASRALHFAITVPASSATRVGAAILLQQMFARVGVQADVARLDHATMVADLASGDFDAALSALSLDPDPAAVRSAWGSGAPRDGGFNFGGYASATVDALLDTAARASDVSAAGAWYGRAYQQIVDDAPAIFLYEPVGLVAYDAAWWPAGVRPDAWWAGLATWRRR